MSALDWIFLAVLLVSLVLGAWRGFVYEVMSVLNWLQAFFLAQWLAPDVGPHLPMGSASEVFRFAAGFVIVFVVAALAGGAVVWLVTKLVVSSGLQRVDRALGAGFGLVRGMILLLAVAVVMEMTPWRASPWWRESNGVAISKATLAWLKPVLPKAVGKYLPYTGWNYVWNRRRCPQRPWESTDL